MNNTEHSIIPVAVTLHEVAPSAIRTGDVIKWHTETGAREWVTRTHVAADLTRSNGRKVNRLHVVGEDGTERWISVSGDDRLRFTVARPAFG